MVNFDVFQILSRCPKPVKQLVKMTDRAGNEYVTAKCLQAHSDLAKKTGIPLRHITGQCRHCKG